MWLGSTRYIYIHLAKHLKNVKWIDSDIQGELSTENWNFQSIHLTIFMTIYNILITDAASLHDNNISVETEIRQHSKQIQICVSNFDVMI
jgi:hypothetical protein